MRELFININEDDDDRRYSIVFEDLVRSYKDIFNSDGGYTIASFDNLEDAKKCFEEHRDHPWETYQSEGYPDDRGYSVSLVDYDEGGSIEYEEYTADDWKLARAEAEED